jgi:TonB family protein
MKTDRGVARGLPGIFSGRNSVIALIALTLLAIRPVWAGDTEKQIKLDYLEKVLTLRHFYSGEHLTFHPDGTLQGDAPVGPWTVDGQLEVEDVHLRGVRLVIKGRRIHRIFDAQLNLQDQFRTVENSRDKKNKELEKDLRRLKVEIEIELPSEKPDEKDVTSAMHAVFLTSSESMMDIVPSYWRGYFAKQEGKPLSSFDPKKEHVSYPKVGSGVSPPHVMLQPDPEYSDEARKARYQGTVLVSMVIDASGAPTDMQIARPLGMGLDEKAIAAISTWKFDPALKNGEPVAVAIMVEVSFRLY